jgi:hypothetical protein
MGARRRKPDATTRAYLAEMAKNGEAVLDAQRREIDRKWSQRALAGFPDTEFLQGEFRRNRLGRPEACQMPTCGS